MLSEVAGLDVENVRSVVARHKAEPSYRPIVVVEDASLAQVAAIQAHKLDYELPDVLVEEVPTRKYPESLAAHRSRVFTAPATPRVRTTMAP